MIKYKKNSNQCIIKVSDGKKVVVTKLCQEEEFKNLESFIKIANRILSNNSVD